MHKYNKNKVISKLKPLSIGILLTNPSWATSNDNFAIRHVQPHFGNIADFTLDNNDSTWPDAVWPGNVWWVPLEFNTEQRDVIEAIVNPVVSHEGWQGYGISVGSKRKPIASDELDVAKAVGRLAYRPPFGIQWTCTATHVGNGYVVTAGHCVEDPRYVQDACSALSVEWDYRTPRADFPKVVDNTLVGKCQEIISWEFSVGSPATIDHAIFRVDKYPETKVDIEPKPNLVTGDIVHQFSHPGGVKLIWSDSCQITDSLFQYYMHDCWSASGSSGSSLIDAKTKRLVGVLSMGQDSKYFSVRNDVSPIGCFDVNTGKVKSPC